MFLLYLSFNHYLVDSNTEDADSCRFLYRIKDTFLSQPMHIKIFYITVLAPKPVEAPKPEDIATKVAVAKE